MAAERKTRKDFETDSAWRTYMITHPDEFTEEEDEEIEVTIYYKCLNPKCDYVASKKHNIPKSKVPDLVGSLAKGTCPKCGHHGFKLIDEKDYIRLEKEAKLNEKKKAEEKPYDKKIVKITLDKIKKDIEKIEYDLENMLKEGKITPKRYATLMYNLIFSEYKYYVKDGTFDFSMTDFKRLATDVSEAIIEKYDVKESLDTALANYSAEEDLLYLKYTKMIAEESLLSKDGRSLEETSREITTLQEKISIQEDLIRRAEEETKLQEKYNEKRMKKEEKIAERSVEKENNAFLKELLDSTKKD